MCSEFKILACSTRHSQFRPVSLSATPPPPFLIFYIIAMDLSVENQHCIILALEDHDHFNIQFDS